MHQIMPPPTAAGPSHQAWRHAAAAVTAALLPVAAAAAATPGGLGTPPGPPPHFLQAAARIGADLDSPGALRALAGIDYDYTDDYDTYYRTALGVRYPSANRGKYRSGNGDYQTQPPPADYAPADYPPADYPPADYAPPLDLLLDSPVADLSPAGPPGNIRPVAIQDDEQLTAEEEIEAECTVVAATDEVEERGCGNVHAVAVAEVFAMVCDGPASTAEKKLALEDIEEIFMAEDAVAFAEATATAMVECTSNDEDAFLCASITIASEAYSNTTVTAHVSAIATALSGCGCMSGNVTAFLTAESFISLVAEATATATASACITGRGRVVSEAYQSCSTTVFARVFARAAARAIIEGDCIDGDAAAELSLEADVMNVTASSTCGGMASVTVDGVPVPIAA